MRKKRVIIIISILIIILGVGILLYLNHKLPYLSTGGNNLSSEFTSQGNTNFGLVTGSVNSIKNNIIIVNNSSGGQTQVITSNNIRIVNSQIANKENVLKVDNNVIIQGKRSDTSTIAETITLSTSTTQAGINGFSLDPDFIGKIIDVTNNTITIESMEGVKYTINYSSTTKLKKQITGSLSDIKAGDNIVISGIKDQSGTINARSISIINN